MFSALQPQLGAGEIVEHLGMASKRGWCLPRPIGFRPLHQFCCILTCCSPPQAAGEQPGTANAPREIEPNERGGFGKGHFCQPSKYTFDNPARLVRNIQDHLSRDVFIALKAIAALFPVQKVEINRRYLSKVGDGFGQRALTRATVSNNHRAFGQKFVHSSHRWSVLASMTDSISFAQNRHCRAKTAIGRDVRSGSRCEELNLSKSGSQCLTERTSMGCAATSLMGQQGTLSRSRQSKLLL
ncbi:hypothetical protein EDE08_111158 [Bradyrhizobium sp. R2.2-H]|nr:hypothetical protein EDE10_111158 [Bradyrhizobium sp. Y-H1]TCU68749.1 hypothetical protein EDE08_111158 [Bradyrhizobium sp. R2.2-H]